MSKSYFDVSYETNSFVNINEEIKLNAKYVDNGNVLDNVSWVSLNSDIAKVNEKGIVKGISKGIAEIVAKTNDNSFSFFVTVLDGNEDEAIKELIKYQYSNAYTKYNLGIGSGKPNYYYDLISSINSYLFLPQSFQLIDRTYYDKLDLNVKNNGLMDKVEFITLHYTGNMNKGADADNNCSYFNNLEYAASIHFVTGRTNLYRDWNKDDYMAFAGLSEKYAGWHASDTKQGPHKWLKSGVKVKDDKKPIISISKNSYFTINGEETLVKVPEREDGIKITGPTFMFEGRECNSINSQGIAYKVIDGEYYLGNTWWGRQQFGNTLANIGGNYNSIGIESCVDIGSDLWHTWQVTAKLIAALLLKYDLGFDRVVGHHYFSGKDCPQPLLANHGELWDEFMKMVKIEYAFLTKFKDLHPELEVIKGDNVLDNKGLIIQDDKAHCVLYKINILKNGKKVDSITLSSIVESNLKYDGERLMPSLQNLGYEII